MVNYTDITLNFPASVFKKNKTIGVTLGDPAGIGPEITVKACYKLSKQKFPHKFLLIGDYVSIKPFKRTTFDILDINALGGHIPISGKVSKAYGIAAMSYIVKALELLRDGKIDALVTAPVNKEAIQKSYKNFYGHTEFLANALSVKKYVMMLIGGPLKVALVTRHMPLSEVSKKLTKKKILETTIITYGALINQFGIRRPRVAIASLNPHAGENGAFGDEERRVIIPAVKLLKKQYPGVSGPYPSDALFHAAYNGEYDAIVCMYHDQGLIPLKMIAMDKGVNITLGLPYVRTSPDHGTAYDIAGRNIADPSSMIAAIKMAGMLC